jgi:hypothetical protein
VSKKGKKKLSFLGHQPAKISGKRREQGKNEINCLPREPPDSQQQIPIPVVAQQQQQQGPSRKEKKPMDLAALFVFFSAAGLWTTTTLTSFFPLSPTLHACS